MNPILDGSDPELGTVRLCRGCGETWPKDAEFFYFDQRGKVLGHCRACWSERKRINRARVRADVEAVRLARTAA